MSMKKTTTGFGQRLKALREKAGLTQEQLAQSAGLNKFGLAKLEQGVGEPHWPTVLALAQALGVSCDAFVQDIAEGGKTGSEKPRGRPRKEPMSLSTAPTRGLGSATKRPRGRGEENQKTRARRE